MPVFRGQIPSPANYRLPDGQPICERFLTVPFFVVRSAAIRASVRNDIVCGLVGMTWVYTYDQGGNILMKDGYQEEQMA